MNNQVLVLKKELILLLILLWIPVVPYQRESSSIHLPNMLTQSTLIIQENTEDQISYISDQEEYVYFFDNFDDFSKNTHHESIKAVYPNLWALKIANPQTPVYDYSKKAYFSNFKFQNLPNEVYISKSLDLSTDRLSLANYNGTGITIGVLDNGVDFSHPALSGKNNGQYFAG